MCGGKGKKHDMEQNLPDMKLLIVDDDQTVAAILAESLQKVNDDYVVETADSGEEALEKVRQQNYQLVITDYKMPGMSGIDLVRGINKVSPDTQVVLMTAYGTQELRETVDHLGLSGFLDKPFTMQQIREIVRKVLDRTSQQQEEDPFRAGKLVVDDSAVENLLQNLRTDTQARCVLLLSSGGYPVEVAGDSERLDISNLSALVAANFMAAAELAKMLGSGSIFKSSYHEGTDYNIYAYDLEGDLLLAVITDSDRKAGTVWFYTKQAAGELEPLLEDAMSTKSEEPVGDLTEGLDTALDDLFGGGDGGDDINLMSMDDAISAGLIPDEWGE